MYQNLVLIFKENAFDFSFYHVSERMKYKMRNGINNLGYLCTANDRRRVAAFFF